jgi:rod shape-determining protein MreC
VLLLIINQQNSGLNGLRAALSVIVYPVQSLVSLPVQLTEQTLRYFVTYNQLQKENDTLKRQVLLYKTDLLKLDTLEKENIRLRALLEKSFRLGEQVLVAELIAVNQAPYDHIIVVDKGSRFGVHPKQPVIDAHGVFGQVLRVSPFSAEIMLITDPSHALSVEISRNGLRTVAVGSGHYNRLNLPFLPNNADVLPGDTLVTSGLDQIFPQGYPVAIVDQLTPQPNKPFADISATPIAQLDKSREVMIVWSQSKPIPLIHSATPPVSTPSTLSSSLPLHNDSQRVSE